MSGSRRARRLRILGLSVALGAASSIVVSDGLSALVARGKLDERTQVAPRAVHSDTWAISVGERSIQIGKWAFGRRGQKGATYAAAIRAFGRPTSCVLRDRSNATVRWRARGVVATFYTLGGFVSERQNACNAPRWVYVGRVLLTDRRWSTSRGLAIGASVEDVARLYPDAERRHHEFLLFDGWWLTQRLCYVPETAPCPNVIAQTGGGAVVRFVIPIGAGGE